MVTNAARAGYHHRAWSGLCEQPTSDSPETVVFFPVWKSNALQADAYYPS